MEIKEIIQELEIWAPPSYQENYDNARLITGDDKTEITGILISLDCIEEVVEEAIAQNCNLIISHHPIVFSGLKSLTGSTYVERTIIKAIKNDIAIYSIHTNLDNVINGVNQKIADIIGLRDQKVLFPKKSTLSKLVTFTPKENASEILERLYVAGAGQIGNYSQCSFSSEGIGTFKPNDKANPVIGKLGHKETINEVRLEVIFPSIIENKLIKALNESHPYEEVAYYITSLSNLNQEVGAGMIGNLNNEVETLEFMNTIKEKFNLKVIRHTSLHKKKIKRIAVCGGAGSFLLAKAKSENADIFITGDFKYHEFFDAENTIIIMDIGHYESEVFTKELIYERLKEKFSNIAVNLSQVVTNPINYY
ncbi:MAG: Nif3-like dinuclear metal center hexameric protein [Cyclobacteriaceae bacterium]|jgi:dinuclear metal center YbgI/SA1388 family protein|nr:Nif3-like dinuclear metal center hexameric protein [Cyclobacteriaceae bacterium]